MISLRYRWHRLCASHRGGDARRGAIGEGRRSLLLVVVLGWWHRGLHAHVSVQAGQLALHRINSRFHVVRHVLHLRLAGGRIWVERHHGLVSNVGPHRRVRERRIEWRGRRSAGMRCSCCFRRRRDEGRAATTVAPACRSPVRHSLTLVRLFSTGTSGRSFARFPFRLASLFYLLCFLCFIVRGRGRHAQGKLQLLILCFESFVFRCEGARGS